MPDSKPTLELNPSHPLVASLNSESDEEQFGELSQILFDQSCLSSGEQLENPADFVQRLNKLLLKLSR